MDVVSFHASPSGNKETSNSTQKAILTKKLQDLSPVRVGGYIYIYIHGHRDF